MDQMEIVNWSLVKKNAKDKNRFLHEIVKFSKIYKFSHGPFAATSTCFSHDTSLPFAALGTSRAKHGIKMTWEEGSLKKSRKMSETFTN